MYASVDLLIYPNILKNFSRAADSARRAACTLVSHSLATLHLTHGFPTEPMGRDPKLGCQGFSLGSQHKLGKLWGMPSTETFPLSKTKSKELLSTGILATGN